MNYLNLVAPGKFYVVNRGQGIDKIIAGPFDSSERANEDKRRARHEGVGAVVMFLDPVDAAKASRS